MRVKATRQGFYGHFREENDEFDIESDSDFSDSWMTNLVDQPETPVIPAQPVVETPVEAPKKAHAVAKSDEAQPEVLRKPPVRAKHHRRPNAEL